MAVNGYAAAQDVADLKVSTAALAVAMGQRVGTNEESISAVQDIVDALPGQLETIENSVQVVISGLETLEEVKLNTAGDNAGSGLYSAVGNQTPDLPVASSIEDTDLLAVYIPSENLKRATAEALGAYARAPLAEDNGASLVNVTKSGTAAVTRSVAQVLDEHIMITDDGAVGDGTGDDAAAIQSIIDKIRDSGVAGTIKGVPSKNYRTLSSLVLKRGVRLDLMGSAITAAFDDAPIIQVTSDGQSHSWSIRDGSLAFATQQTAAQTDGVCIQTSGAGVNSYMADIQYLTLQNANCGVRGTSETGEFTFLVKMQNLFILNNSGFAIDIASSGAGGNTNLMMEGIYSAQPGGYNTAAKGFRIINCSGIRANNLNVDGAGGRILQVETSFGSIGHLAFENANLTATDGEGGDYPIVFSNCNLIRLGALYTYSSVFNTDGSDIVILRADNSHVITDNILLSSIAQNVTGGGQVYHANAVGTGSLRNEKFSATSSADGSPIAANLADFGAVPLITRWNGQDRATSGSWPVAADNAAAVTLGLPTGMMYKTASGELRVVV